jgi:sugar O-acyltransferase (sialic acid O-acetyltransferase NeuD family)
MKYAILGAGGMARELREILIDKGVSTESIEFFVDSQFVGEKIYSQDIATLNPEDYRIYMAAGDSAIRQSWLKTLGKKFGNFETLIHPTALTGSNVKIGQGGIIAAYCHLTCDIVLGQFCQLNLQTTISHDCVIGDFFTSSPKVSIPGNVQIGSHVFLGTAAAVLPGVSICDNVVVGAGALVTKDIAAPGTYVGVPARRIDG